MTLLGQGQEEIVEATFSDGAPFGTARDRSGDQVPGMLSVMVIPAHEGDPRARIRVQTNGPIYCDPAMLDQMLERITYVLGNARLREAYQEAKEQEEETAEQLRQSSSQKQLMKAAFK